MVVLEKRELVISLVRISHQTINQLRRGGLLGIGIFSDLSELHILATNLGA